ncbi:aflatoxin B1 aldehyde reductase member 2 [Pyronema domesticum]|uniref:Similar to Aflatoxin B1 aldehyde reductase member 2 acc. no. Q8CG76 n=1 Tax=Pyronema omphalodes (strain CBS 100304) TaxID=1076935 RepID=U4L5B0_PYROM|nr:aflatoxin B1 aldehyde reductase member 2 [Pyronema domesticum]CCX11976.1 Similar to Aflatoxin B1 aldehyde reductase member 2; acc. no. Q8CG76 [Pyronema omphalodes CBS 100304]
MALTTKPRVILGCMTFGNAEHGGRVTEVSEVRKIFEHFSNSGHKELDTARVYIKGEQEAFTAAAGYQDLNLEIATKIYPQFGLDHTRACIRATIEKSLSELKTDCVDIYYLHAADRNTPLEETLAACDELYREGKFKRLGISNFTAFEVAETAVLCRERGWVRPTVYQAMYNCVTRAIEKELVPACRRYGLDIVVYNPIAGGLFSGNFKPDTVPETGRFSDKNPAGKMYRGRYFHECYFSAVEMLSKEAEKQGISMLEVAFRWLLHHSALNMGARGNDGIIIGVSSLEQLTANLKALEKGPLPEDLLAKVEEAWEMVKRERVVDYWHLDLKYTYEWPKEKL